MLTTISEEQRLRALTVPTGPVDVVIDTDAANEVDDQFAIAYLLRSTEKLHTVALYAEPFSAEWTVKNPAEGERLSYEEILHVLQLAGETVNPVFHGSAAYLADEHTPQVTDAAQDLCRRAMQYTPEKPLYVVAIGVITNIASALLMEPRIADRMVVVWLGGHARHFPDTAEFNLIQDVPAARVVMGSGVPLVQLPCGGVVDRFIISKPELEYWLVGKNPLADYLANNVIKAEESYRHGMAWSRIIYDVTAVGWLLNDDDRFMHSYILPTLLPDMTGHYEQQPQPFVQRYVYSIRRDELFTDLFRKLTM